MAPQAKQGPGHASPREGRSAQFASVGTQRTSRATSSAKVRAASRRQTRSKLGRDDRPFRIAPTVTAESVCTNTRHRRLAAVRVAHRTASATARSSRSLMWPPRLSRRDHATRHAATSVGASNKAASCSMVHWPSAVLSPRRGRMNSAASVDWGTSRV